MKAPDLGDTFRPWPLLDGLDLLFIYFDAPVTDNITKKNNSFHAEGAFLEVSIQLLTSQYIKNTSQMLNMIISSPAVYQYVIKINNYKLA